MSKPTILLAERSPELRRGLFVRLLCEGFDVIESSGPSEVFRALRQRRQVHCFILSTSFEEPGDGVELARLLRHCESAPHVILTTDSSRDNWNTAPLEAGVAEHIARPCALDEVLAAVHRLCPTPAFSSSEIFLPL